MDFKVGDEVITAKGLWHNGQDISNRLAKVISTTSYILIEVYSYEDNPVKCFRYEVEKRPKNPYTTYKDVVEEFEIDFEPLI